MKTCLLCGCEKSLDMFSPLKTGRDGKNPVCKPCRSEAERAKRLADLDGTRARDRARHKANPDAKKAAIKRYYDANRDRIIATETARYAAKADEIKGQKKQYRALNPEKIRFHNGSRRAAQKMAMPTWADRVQIAAIYAEASKLWRKTGEPHHVDHIVPLKNPLVCGLHVPANLQILRGVDNIRKGNRFETCD